MDYMHRQHSIVHSVNRWLPITENWIFNQVNHIVGFKSYVLARELVQPYPDVENMLYKKRNYKTKIIDRISRKLFGFYESDRTLLNKVASPRIMFSHFGPIGVRDMRLKSEKHLVRFYGYDLHQLPNEDPAWIARYKELFKRCSAIVVEGPYMKGMLVNSLGCPEEKVHICHLGTQVKDVDFRIRSRQHEKVNVLLAASFTEKKGLIYALDALGKISQTYLPYIQLHIAGDAASDQVSQAYKKKMLDTVESYGLEKNVIWYGYLSKDKLQSLAFSCDFALHPSVWSMNRDCEGGYPVVLLDIMATGLPVISTSHCDIPDVVTNENGYLCDERNVDQLVDAMIDILDSDNLQRRSVQARKDVEEKFDLEELGRQLTGIITQV